MSGTLSFSSSNSVSEPSGPGGSPLFSNLCGLLQSIADQRGTEQKKRRLERFLYDWRAKYGLDVYEAMRLILPHVSFSSEGGSHDNQLLIFCAWFQLDKSRYNMKETKLAKVYTEALGLSRNSLDAYNLLKFKQPSIGSSFKYAVSLSFSSVSSFYIYLAVRRKRLATFPRLHTTSSQVVRQYRNQHRRFMM